MIKTEIQNESTIIHVYGKIDATNASQFETEVFSAIEGQQVVVLDLEEMNYISSAGLRVLLKIKKAVKDFSIINVSSEVFEILEMTGFSEMMTVRRKRRRFSADGCTEIARGAMGVIYRLNQDTILKVYDKSLPLESIYQGQAVLKKLFIHDIPCAIPFDIVDVGDTHGSVYEMIDMDTLAQYMNKHPDETEACGTKAAALLKTLHQGELPGNMLPKAKDAAASWLEQLSEYLTAEDVAAYQKLFDDFKDTGNFLHLDFHPKNIMIKDDDLMIIDLDDACTGDPLIDIGCLLMTIGNESWDDQQCMKFIGITREQRERYASAFFKTYFETEDDEEIARLLKPLRPIAALRTLFARAHRIGLTPEERQQLIDDALAFVHSTLY